jgi:dTDP-4-dehydrorhamnose reductase
VSGSGVVILGARSWVGFRLVQAFAEKSISVIGTTSSPLEVIPAAVRAMPQLEIARGIHEFTALIRRQRPNVVFNLLRGENVDGLQVHAQIARLCAELGSRYVYASSALVFEGHPANLILDEAAQPNATTQYGQFKAECERLLVNEYPQSDWQILRFTSIQGWSPWKPSRNEAFLTRLSKGDNIDVNKGIIQNRMLDLDFVRQVRDNALLAAARGVMHMGTDDASDETEFLCRVAVAFGWSADHVRPSQMKNCHIALDCARTHALTGGRWRRTEAQTIQGLLSERGLAHLIATT